ncbi:MAG: TAXI family TRAP transporter solute-binding subunit [Verrucomicrobiales bacterium]|jgi:TRAP transporter TAXI family solute receptor|nr:TAXI family TRAP transporter solute-binding subunit [Verrucomicrobiales bacterium]
MSDIMNRYLACLRSQWPLLVGIFAVAAVFAYCWRFVDPAPPRSITIAAGPADGAYYWWAQKYAGLLAKQGIKVNISVTNGAADNLKLMLDANREVDAAFIQGGAVTAANLDPDTTPLRALAALFHEPLWLFHQPTLTVNSLRDLKGKRVAIGLRGSGGNLLATELLKWSGVTGQNSTLTIIDDNEAGQALTAGRLDAMFAVGAVGVPVIRRLLTNPAVRTHAFDDAAAYVRRYDYLDAVTLPAGVVDMANNQPARDLTLLAPVATLIARDDLHPAIVSQLLAAATALHHRHNLLSNTIDFPAAHNTELLMHKDAARYLQNGPSFLHRYLPYHLAAFIDRTKIMLLPLLTLLIPLFKMVMPTYRWSMRRNIWKWYKSIRAIERDHANRAADNATLLKRLDDIEANVKKTYVPYTFAWELYTLRNHIIMIREMLTAK